MSDTNYAQQEGLTFIPGDFILVSGHGFFDRLIQIGQRFRFPKEQAQWNHVALIADEKGGIIEALGRGVTYSFIEKYVGKKLKYIHIPIDDPKKRRQAVIYALHQINQGYGFLEFSSIVLTILFGFKYSFQDKNENVCSVLVALALQTEGIVLKKYPYLCSPADLAQLFDSEVK